MAAAVGSAVVTGALTVLMIYLIKKYKNRNITKVEILKHEDFSSTLNFDPTNRSIISLSTSNYNSTNSSPMKMHNADVTDHVIIHSHDVTS